MHLQKKQNITNRAFLAKAQHRSLVHSKKVAKSLLLYNNNHFTNIVVTSTFYNLQQKMQTL